MAHHEALRAPAPATVDPEALARRGPERAPASKSLQRTLGNQAVMGLAHQGQPGRSVWRAARGGLLQASLTVSHPDDPFEREADQVAHQILAVPAVDQTLSSSAAAQPVPTRHVPRVSTLSSDRSAHAEVGGQFEQRLDAARGSGGALPSITRSFMEARFGADFGSVRVHADDRANQLARSIDARAFTQGQDIYFAQGEYRPSSAAGQHLIAHELTHVVQQGSGGPARFAQSIATFRSEHSPAELASQQARVVDVQQQGSSAALRRKGKNDAKLPQKTVTVNITNVAGGNGRGDSALSWSNKNVYAQANVTLQKGTEVTLNDEDSKAALGDDLILHEYDDVYKPTDEEKKLFKINQSSSAPTLYFVKKLSANSTGEAFTPSIGVGFNGAAISNTGSSQTVAHELGHVLLDPGPHVTGGTNRNLMHPTIGDDKTELTDEQIQKIRSSGFAK
jgi:hypothetical protein